MPYHEGAGCQILSRSLLFTKEPTMVALFMKVDQSGSLASLFPPQAIVCGERKEFPEIVIEGIPPLDVVYAEKWNTVYVDPNLFPIIISTNLLTAEGTTVFEDM
jgi:hypothetical protein